jgi:hypothetical protein
MSSNKLTTDLMSNPSISSGLNSKLTFFIYAIIIASSFLILITTGSEGENALKGFITGNVTLLVSIIIMFSLIWYRINGVGLYQLSISLFPFIMLMVIILWLLVILQQYFDRITSNKVSNYYVSFVRISTILTIIQLLMLVNVIRDNNFEKYRSIPPKMFSILMLLGTINLIIVITLGVILKSYVTDC